MHRRSALVRLFAGLITLAIAPASFAQTPRIQVKSVASEPPRGERGARDARLVQLRARVADKPRDRTARFALVDELRASGHLREAIEQARQWRAHDAYNLLVVRLLGDMQAELGDRRGALRTWSSVVELLPQDASAHRALASALKQAGELKAACARLARSVQLNPDDPRLAFELADCQQRTGHVAEAEEGFERIAALTTAPDLIRVPARQRLAQVYGERQRAATSNGDAAGATNFAAKRAALAVAGGSSSDIKVFLTWDTDRSDVDLWITTPAGERVWYRARRAKDGSALFGDVTSGYGPETFSAPIATPGTYTVQVNYFSTARRGLREARGEIAVVLAEGRPEQRRVVLPYRLYQPGQTVTVARIVVDSPR